ncbi:MAG: 4-alpha-glucanotransferase [Rikenellaceae bacterium]
MKIKLEIEYATQPGEEVRINFNGESSALSTNDCRNWYTEIESVSKNLQYSYSIYINDTLSRNEWGTPHHISLPRNIDNLHIIDRWQQEPQVKALYSSLFTDVIFRREKCAKFKPSRGGATLVVDAPSVRPHQQLVVVGSSDDMGAWDASKGVNLCRIASSGLWFTPNLKSVSGSFKFAIIDRSNGEVVWELGDNRTLDAQFMESGTSMVINVEPPQFSTSPWRGAGVAIPVFSLRTNQSMGVGEFADLKLLVDWASSIGQSVVQVLPINDTTMFNTWEDSYPYNANSSFALHPQYIAPLKVGEISDQHLLAELLTEGKRLNKLSYVDYEAVISLKSRYLKAIYQQIGSQTLSSKEYKAFFKANKIWLEPYALFMFLRDKYQTPNFEKWGDHASYSSALLKRYASANSREYAQLAYHYFVQYHLHLQLLEAKEYAASKGVAFKGDVPIGVSRTSVDAWVNPRLFRLNSQAGAPPDDFAAMGQNWGFPTYNWDEMAKDGYAWWKDRFKKMAEYFDAYRIDHILGFFRIWEMPTDAKHGLLGFFNPAFPYNQEEIAAYGFNFQERYTAAYITDWILDEIFGGRSDEVKRNYLCRISNDEYQLSDQYSTQVKISERVDDSELKEGLMLLLDEVLFIEDSYKRGLYHPRISAYNSYVFRTLSDEERESFSALYNDFFYHRHNDFWRDNAMKKLPELIASTKMMACGEDLGMIPQSVPAVMASEQILSLEIQRMPKEPWRTFGDTYLYPYNSVCTTSTHDMNPIRAWWLENKENSQLYYNKVLGFEGVAPKECEAFVCAKIIEQHLESPAMWTILPLQDWLSIDDKVRFADARAERINIPENSRHYWQYRAHLTIEELINSYDLNEKISLMIKNSRR